MTKEEILQKLVKDLEMRGRSTSTVHEYREKVQQYQGNLRHKAMLMLAYGSGLRLSEICHLKITDIESDQMRIFIRSGKGNRDRYAMLPQSTPETLREYWKMYRPKEWLFESPKQPGAFRTRALQDAFKAALKRSKIKKQGSLRTLRHCFATHLYEDGHNLLALKKLISLLKRWLLGTHQGAVSDKHMQAYLEEYTFRFNRWKATKRGLLFYRLLEGAIICDPFTYNHLVNLPNDF